MSAQMDDEIGVLAAHLHAATAHFVDRVTAFDDSNQWAGIGMHGCAHWLTIATGIDLSNARELLRVGHALRVLPLIREAFRTGRLSFDKARAVTRVATADDEAIWLDLAVQASGSQLALICRQYRYAIAIDDPARAARQRARRRVVSWWLDEDGMLALYAVLPPEEGQLVLSAIEAAVVRPTAAVTDSHPDVDPCAEGEPEHPTGARRADALVRICECWLDDATAAAPAGASRTELVVHVDLDTLVSAGVGGRCHIEDGPAVSVAAARRLGCDALVTTVLERDGAPLDLGRSRFVTGRLRRALQARDQGCRYPGCPVPAASTEGHHIVHWVDGGLTELPNLVSLCRFHHHRHHEGAFHIAARSRAQAERGEFHFETADGQPIAVSPTSIRADGAAPAGWPRETFAGVTPRTPAAEGGGQSFDLDHTVLVVAGNITTAAARRVQNPPP